MQWVDVPELEFFRFAVASAGPLPPGPLRVRGELLRYGERTTLFFRSAAPPNARYLLRATSVDPLPPEPPVALTLRTLLADVVSLDRRLVVYEGE